MALWAERSHGRKNFAILRKEPILKQQCLPLKLNGNQTTVGSRKSLKALKALLQPHN